jgi:biofilm PGA synthesis N-glycosyltransferase PgaC
MTPMDIITYSVMFISLYFQVFLFVTLIQKYEHIREERSRGDKERGRSSWASVSIIVPAYNEEKTVGKTLDSLLALDYPPEKLNIVVVSDGSTDKTVEVARGYTDPRITVYEKENGGKYTALNYAIERTKTDFVGCLDADSFVTPQALKIIMLYFDKKDVMAVCPSVQIWKAEKFLQKIQATEFLIGALTKKIFTFLGAVYVTPGPFSIYRRTVFETLGGFRYGYSTEDMEMALRMQSHHMVIETAQDALVYTIAPSSFIALYKQRVRWVSGHLKNTMLSYRFMLFKRSYGNLGMLALPFAFLSVLTAVFFFGYSIYTFGNYLTDTVVRIFYMGINWSAPTFEWFFIGSGVKRVLIYYMMVLLFIYLFLASRLTHRRFRVSRGMVYFFFMYGIIAPLWLGKSVWNLLRAKEAPWR